MSRESLLLKCDRPAHRPARVLGLTIERSSFVEDDRPSRLVCSALGMSLDLSLD
ncbi:hypothetical protein [Thermoleptolyngbya sp.]